MSDTFNPERAATESFKQLMPGVETWTNDGRQFIEMIAPLEDLRHWFKTKTDANAVRATRDLKIKTFPEKFRSIVGVDPTIEQARQHETEITDTLDREAYDSTRTFYRAHADVDRQLAKLDAEHRTLLSDPESLEALGKDPTPVRAAWAMEVQHAQDRIKGQTWARVETICRGTDDKLAHALKYVLEQAIEDGKLDQLGIVGDPAGRMGLERAIREQQAARVPRWIQAARARHRELLSPVEDSLARLILNGQRIAGKPPHRTATLGR